MAEQRFGGRHTEKKLEALESYLKIYSQALKNQPFKRAFFDAFAGTGRVELLAQSTPLFGSIDAEIFIEGSAVRALRCDPLT